MFVYIVCAHWTQGIAYTQGPLTWICMGTLRLNYVKVNIRMSDIPRST